MYYISRDEKLTEMKIAEIIQAFKTVELPQLEKRYQYFKGNQAIMRKTVNDDTKPCNRIVTNFCDNIVSTYSGYLTGIDITYSSDDDIEAIQDVLNYNDVSSEDTQFLEDALTFGVGFEINWIDEEGKQRFKTLDPRDCIPVYYNTLEEDLAAVIRFYTVSNTNLLEADYIVEVYDERETRVYKANQAFSAFSLMDYKPNFYGQVPITVFALNREWESAFDKVITLQDAYNTLLSSETDDFEAFCDAYLVLDGIDDVDPEQLHLMKTNRVLVLPEGGKASFLYKTISDTQIENMLDRIETNIRKISATPDFTDSTFGTQSGVAIKYKLINFENKASKIEKAMTKALQRRIELICSILHLTTGEETWRDVNIQFTRNLPIDYQDLTTMINQLRGLVSSKTLIAQLPFIQNIDQEMDAVEEENQRNASLYNFNTEADDETTD